MPSKKSKVFAYLSDQLYGRVSEFKQRRSLPSDSQTLIAILTEFFGIEQQPLVSITSNALEERISEIEKAIASLTKRFANLEETSSSLPSELVPSELEETSDSLPAEETSSSLPSELVVSELKETSDSLLVEVVDKDYLWVICKVDKFDRDRFSCWTGSFKHGFTADLNKAQTYQEKSLNRIANKIANSEHDADTSLEFISYKTLGDLKKMRGLKQTALR